MEGDAGRTSAQAEEDNRPTEKTINMISWGAGQASKRPKKDPSTRPQTDVISFSGEDLLEIQNPKDDAVVVSMTIAKHPVKKILVDSGSSTDVLFYDAFVRMGLSPSLLRLKTQPSLLLSLLRTLSPSLLLSLLPSLLRILLLSPVRIRCPRR